MQAPHRNIFIKICQFKLNNLIILQPEFRTRFSDLVVFCGSHECGPARLSLRVDELPGAPLVGDLGQAHVRHVDLAALHDEHEHVGAAVVRPRGVPAVVQHELERHRIVFNRSVEQEGEISLKIMGAIHL